MGKGRRWDVPGEKELIRKLEDRVKRFKKSGDFD